MSTRAMSSGSDSQHNDKQWPVGSGSPPGTIPTPFERAPGLERLEYLAEVEGVPLFLSSETLKIEAKGTLDKPIMVETIQGERIVGCTGFPKYSHHVSWMNLKGYDHVGRCADCGQAFKLKFAEMPEYKGKKAREHVHSHSAHSTQIHDTKAELKAKQDH